MPRHLPVVAELPAEASGPVIYQNALWTPGSEGEYEARYGVGPEGPRGPEGARGEPGPAGVGGVTLRGRIDSPAALPTDATPGDAYLRDTGAMVWTLDSGWLALPPLQGADGPQGPQGDPGPEGPEGPAGADGPRGPAGADGVNGTSFAFRGQLSSQADLPAGAPTNDAYVVGAEMWVMSTSGWVSMGALAAGPRGADGADGPRGAAGPQGPPGESGLHFEGPWAPGAPYSKGSLVSYQGVLYAATVDAPAAASWAPGPIPNPTTASAGGVASKVLAAGSVIDPDAPASNTSADPTWFVRVPPTAKGEAGYLAMSILLLRAAIPAVSQLYPSALTLRLYRNEDQYSDGSTSLRIYGLDPAGWDPATVTWATKPAGVVAVPESSMRAATVGNTYGHFPVSLAGAYPPHAVARGDLGSEIGLAVSMYPFPADVNTTEEHRQMRFVAAANAVRQVPYFEVAYSPIWVRLAP